MTGTLSSFLGLQIKQHQNGVGVPACLHGKGPSAIPDARRKSSRNNL
jgi:hypothetical protein